ncbi:CPBP family intramembrane metalloprotease [Akkermansiaceae bacterium]|nr:CPBP family intramembrane metalloprotease [Akkermansiaceae bacterium]MDB4286547.1 CPBP family intramembrane metalloprotease [bacterium]MDA7684144.1 CPBP family intramembrane metalloprotease [Akkermansiaceae bacterium]MDA7864066.1 CPBP family intramembrane metalloprotease [Akkermansiaceae bacterium]MDA7931833.1 CPBP family intramembrane metalloprotease [Akkermansiaceae bacterium]
MRLSALGDVAKIVAFVVGSFLLAALISPPLYEMGKGFAEVALKKDTTDELTWLAGKAKKAEFAMYFKRALMLSALVLIFPLIFSLRLRMNPSRLRDTPWSIYLHPAAIGQTDGQPLRRVRFGFLQTLVGFLLASGLFLAMTWLLFNLNWFQWRVPPTSDQVTALLPKAAKPAFFASVIEEVIFRGMLLGIFLRAFRPWFAITSLSFLFAAVHFLHPPDGVTIADPSSAKAGFEMLHLIGMRFLDPQAMLYEFATLFLVGIILAHARYGTASLWLPIGLHSGWVFSVVLFKKMAHRRPDLPKEFDLYMGHSLKEGLLPLIALTITWILIAIYMRMIRPRKPKQEAGEE